MKIKLDSEYNEVIITCKKRKGKVKFIYIDEDTHEVISEQIIDNLEIGKVYDIDLDIPSNYEKNEKEEKQDKIDNNNEKEEKEEVFDYEGAILQEMKRLRDAIDE